MVGDDAQSIYSFRGANIDNILKFKSTYSGCRVFKLERNYRSTQSIVNAANSLIQKNKEQIHKTVYSENNAGEKIRVTSSYSDYEEGYIIAGKIAEMRMLGIIIAFPILLFYIAPMRRVVFWKKRCVNEIFLIKYMGAVFLSAKRDKGYYFLL